MASEHPPTGRIKPHTENQKRFYPKEFKDVYLDYPPERFEISTHRVRWNSGRRYTLGRRLGSGHFGDVFAATCPSRDGKKGVSLVVKTLKLERKEKIKLRREIKMLELVKGGPNIVSLVDTIRDAESGKKGLVFERIDYGDYHALFLTFSPEDVRFYMYQLLLAVRHTHSLGIMHRDIKPSNVLIDHKHKVLRLIDWGVAGFYIPDEVNGRSPGTRCYMSPELCLRYDFYDYAVDMWAVGCMLGSMLFLVHPLMRGKGSWFNQLRAITEVMGSEAILRCMDKLCITIEPNQLEELQGHPGREWASFVSDTNRHLVCDVGLDLLTNLLCCDHTRRMTVTEALAHPFFNPVRGSEAGTVAAPNSSSPDSYTSSSAYYSSSSDTDVGNAKTPAETPNQARKRASEADYGRGGQKSARRGS